MHEWGDKDFDWHGLNAAGSFIARYCMHKARLKIHWKEKYGTLRIEWLSSCLFGYSPVHNLVYPGYLYYKWPSWVMKIDRGLGSVLRVLRITNLIAGYQLKTLNRALARAVEYWPHLKDEIEDDVKWELELR